MKILARTPVVSLVVVILMAVLAYLTPAWIRETNARASTTPTTYVYVVGDSISASWTLPPAQGFPNRIFDRMWGQEPNRSHGVINAVGGRCLIAAGCAGTPLAGAWQSEILGATPKPTTVILEIGINDLGHASTAAMENAYALIINQASTEGVTVLVATIPPRESSQWPSWWWWGPQMLEINAWLRTTYGPNVIDFYALLVSDGWMAPRFMTGDGVHPNKYGHLEMGDSIPLGSIA
jgi:lysophospholipase L1-like esterase